MEVVGRDDINIVPYRGLSGVVRGSMILRRIDMNEASKILPIEFSELGNGVNNQSDTTAASIIDTIESDNQSLRNINMSLEIELNIIRMERDRLKNEIIGLQNIIESLQQLLISNGGTSGVSGELDGTAGASGNASTSGGGNIEERLIVQLTRNEKIQSILYIEGNVIDEGDGRSDIGIVLEENINGIWSEVAGINNISTVLNTFKYEYQSSQQVFTLVRIKVYRIGFETSNYYSSHIIYDIGDGGSLLQ